jgi:hypothetical protein
MVDSSPVRPEDGAKPAWIVVAEDHPIVELEVDVIVRPLGRRVPIYPKAAGHAEMDDKRRATYSEE